MESPIWLINRPLMEHCCEKRPPTGLGKASYVNLQSAAPCGLVYCSGSDPAVDFLSTHSSFLISAICWGLHWALHICFHLCNFMYCLWWASSRDHNYFTCFLISSQVCWWNLVGILCDPITFAFRVSKISAPQNWCQNYPAWAVLGPL